MLYGNAFSLDTDEQRLERLLALSANIDTHAAELSVSGDRLATAQTAGPDWSDACTNAGIEDGDSG